VHSGGRPNKRMQLTELRAAPVRQTAVPPCAAAGEMDGGTGSQLTASAGPTFAGAKNDDDCRGRRWKANLTEDIA
jgi:hypothetical protein